MKFNITIFVPILHCERNQNNRSPIFTDYGFDYFKLEKQNLFIDISIGLQIKTLMIRSI